MDVLVGLAVLAGDGSSGADTALAQIIRLVEEAQETKPRVQRLAERAAPRRALKGARSWWEAAG